MKKGTKRIAHAEEGLPTTRRRLRDPEAIEEGEAQLEKITRDEKERLLQQRVAAQNNEDNEWEDASDDDEEEEEEEDDSMNGDCIDEIVEEEIIDDGADDDDNDEDYAEFQRETDELSKGMRRVTFDDAAMQQGEDNEGDEAAPTIWRSDQAELGTQEMQLEYANKAYDSFFQLRTEYPCLSFDVLQDKDASNRTKYPLSLTLVCGSQADELSKNQLYVLRITNICRTKHDADSDSDSEGSYIGDEGDSEDDNDQEEEVNNGEPIMVHRTISHYGTANRVRCAHHDTNLVAVWSDAGHVQVFNLENDVSILCDHAAWAKKQARQGVPKKQSAMLFCTPSTSHKTEGYGLDWSTVAQGVFASGDCNGDLFVWKPSDDGRWKPIASSTVSDNATSVEEIQWSPTQADVLIATRVGGVVEVWDTRDMRKRKISWQADPTDINVASWNRARQASHLLVTGADSGAVAVWDLRKIGERTPIQQLPWHKGSITSVEFSLHNESVLSATADDGQCTLWDLSLERDPSEEKEVIGELFGRQDLTGIPDQLMFQHQGLVHPKEAHWHAQIPGMVITTDYAGLHLFRPMNWRSLMK